MENVADQISCPLCNKEKDMGKKAKSLYGYPVCRKCYYGFANRRQFAFVIDAFFYNFVVINVIAVIVGLAVGVIFAPMKTDQNTSESVLQILAIFNSLIVMFLFSIKDGYSGHSLGKVMMGVQVLYESGKGANFLASFKRNILLIIPVVPIVVAFLLCKGPRWGDGWAKTRVIWKKYRDRVPFSTFETGPKPAAISKTDTPL